MALSPMFVILLSNNFKQVNSGMLFAMAKALSSLFIMNAPTNPASTMKLWHAFDCPNQLTARDIIAIHKCWWKVNIPTFHRNEDPLDWSWFALEKRREGLWLQVAIMAVLTSIWRLRNGAVFDNKKVVVDTEFCRIQELAFFWVGSRNPKFKMKLNNWISNPKLNIDRLGLEMKEGLKPRTKRTLEECDRGAHRCQTL
ncbi:hypothetical protein LXL04_027581 [Taraxacum kok-saghyz]